jgi:NADPH:quinone reductase-like Zn-dependent oxidoreductase
MRAVQFEQFGDPEVLEIVEVPDPHPAAGQIRVRVHAAGINPIDWKVRRGGPMADELPQRTGREAAGVVDELGEGVDDVAVGDGVFGFAAGGGGVAELVLMSDYAPIAPSLDFAHAAALPVAIETAARVIGTASERNHDYLRSLGAEPVTYAPGLVERVNALAPGGVDAAFDVAGGGSLPDLVQLAGGPEHVITIADYPGSQTTGVPMTGGPGTERAVHALRDVGALIESGRFSLPIQQMFALDEIADAHRLSETGHVRGKLVVLVD